MALLEKFVQIVNPNLLTREVNELLVALEEDDNNYDIEAIEERILIKNLSKMNFNVQKCLCSVFKISLAYSLGSQYGVDHQGTTSD
jgi:hypothetical protein